MRFVGGGVDATTRPLEMDDWGTERVDGVVSTLGEVKIVVGEVSKTFDRVMDIIGGLLGKVDWVTTIVEEVSEVVFGLFKAVDNLSEEVCGVASPVGWMDDMVEVDQVDVWVACRCTVFIVDVADDFIVSENVIVVVVVATAASLGSVVGFVAVAVCSSDCVGSEGCEFAIEIEPRMITPINVLLA